MKQSPRSTPQKPAKKTRSNLVLSDVAKKSRAHSKGSYATGVASHYCLGRVFTVCRKKLNIQINDIKNIRPRTAYKFVAYMLSIGVSKRTLTNYFSHIRNYFRNEKLPLHYIPSNQQLGISGAPRHGTHKSLDLEGFEQANTDQNGNRIITDKGIQLAIRLQCLLGLRRKEAVCAAVNLPFWINELSAGCHRLTILSSSGPKGGRPRTITISDPMRALVTQMITELDLWVKNNDGFIISASSIKSAMRIYSRAIHSLGFRMPYSTHSFRYNWAIQQYRWYISLGYTSKMALMRLAEDLGHGSNRIYYVKSVYLREIFHPENA